MTESQRELWTRIEAFELDIPGASLPFSRRLARENDWSSEFTQRAIGEYKRFVFLAMCAGHPVTPSDQVDQVWHLHLTYTRSYWDEFCGQVLPHPLHHGPTRGGSDEGAKFHDWYARTQESYRQFFGIEPPRDLWPIARVRFGDDVHFVRVYARRNWIVAKPQWKRSWIYAHGPHPNPPPQACPEGARGSYARRKLLAGTNLTPSGALWAGLRGRVGVGAMSVSGSHQAPKTRWSLAFVALLLLIAGCDQVGRAVPVFDWKGPQFLLFYVIFTPAVLLASWAWRQAWRAPAGEIGDHELPRDPYEIALLNSGEWVALQAAVAELSRRRVIEIGQNGTLAPGPGFGDATAATHPFEAAVLASLNEKSGQKLSELSENLGVKSELQELQNGLRARGLAMSADQGRRARNATLSLALLPVVVGVTKIAIGMDRGKPVGFLVVLTIIALIVALSAFAIVPLNSARGDKALAKLHARHANLRAKSAPREASHSAGGKAFGSDLDMVALRVGLYGMHVLDDTVRHDLGLDHLPIHGGDSSSHGSHHSNNDLFDSGYSGGDSGDTGGGDSGGGDSGGGDSGGGDSGGGGCGGCGGGGD